MRPRQLPRKHSIHPSRLSGPAILQISSYGAKAIRCRSNLAPSLNVENFLADRKRTRPKAELKTILAEVLPTRLAHALAGAASNLSIANVPDRDLSELANRLKRWQLKPAGSEGWPKAEVTVCGIDTAALSSKTMEARAVPGLFCDRRSGGRDRMAGRLQFPVGMVERLVRGQCRLTSSSFMMRDRQAARGHSSSTPSATSCDTSASPSQEWRGRFRAYARREQAPVRPSVRESTSHERPALRISSRRLPAASPAEGSRVRADAGRPACRSRTS